MDAFDSSQQIRLPDRDETVREDAPVFIDLWHPRCSACRAVRKRLTEFKHRVRNRFSVGSLNISEVPDVTDDLDVERVPALLVCRDGSVEACLHGTDHIFRFIAQIEEIVCG